MYPRLELARVVRSTPDRGHMPIGAVLFPALVLGCIFYYLVFAEDLSRYDAQAGFFNYALNHHDHLIYLDNIERLRARDVYGYQLSNDIGIAAIYLVLARAMPFLVDPDLTLIALVFNCAVMLCCYLVHASICERLNLGALGKLTFFSNLSLIYFAQMVNKDMLTLLAFLLAALVGIQRRYWVLIILVPFFFMVRQQLAVFLLVYCFLMIVRRPVFWILGMYVLFSLAAGYMSVFFSIIGDESLGSGFSAFLVEFNRQYYAGYLLFNPVRVVQYVLDAYASFFFLTEHGGVDTAKILRLPQLVVVAILSPHILSLLSQFRFWLRSPARPLVIVIVSYLLVWLMNPTVNARYVMLITPILILFGLFVRNAKARASR